jgi:hypothetical protein
MNNNIELKLEKLSKNSFRSLFHLSDKDKKYIQEKGMDTIREHAKNFITNKLKVKQKRDGKLTPYNGHPVFVAQHATGICCRGCMKKWYGIPKDKVLDEFEIRYFTDVIIKFIEKDLK